MKLYLKLIGCSCYTCFPQTVPTAQTTQRKVAAPSTSADAPPVAQRLLTNTWPKTMHNINIQANTNKKTRKQYINT